MSPSTIVQKKFSFAASQYDILTPFHREIGQDLMKTYHQPLTEADTILDLGMGTGWMSHILKKRYPLSLVIGLDFAAGMVATAKKNHVGCPVVQADAHTLPFRQDVFDVIISNLTCQWINDWAGFLADIRGRLTARGSFCFSVFGYQTFQEIFGTLQHCVWRTGQTQKHPLPRLLDQKQLEQKFVNAGYPDVELKTFYYKIPFNDLVSILRWTKNIGANGLCYPLFIGKDHLHLANRVYRRRHRWMDRRVYTTFEIIVGQWQPAKSKG